MPGQGLPAETLLADVFFDGLRQAIEAGREREFAKYFLRYLGVGESKIKLAVDWL
jgi:hypothetical protein